MWGRNRENHRPMWGKNRENLGQCGAKIVRIGALAENCKFAPHFGPLRDPAVTWPSFTHLPHTHWQSLINTQCMILWAFPSQNWLILPQMHCMGLLLLGYGIWVLVLPIMGCAANVRQKSWQFAANVRQKSWQFAANVRQNSWLIWALAAKS